MRDAIARVVGSSPQSPRDERLCGEIALALPVLVFRGDARNLFPAESPASGTLRPTTLKTFTHYTQACSLKLAACSF